MLFEHQKEHSLAVDGGGHGRRGVCIFAARKDWRMALAKQMLRQNESHMVEIAERVGYSSASAFSVAFTRSVGQSPAHYARSNH